MTTITTGIYNYTLTKIKPNEYTLLTPSLTGLVNPYYTIYKINANLSLTEVLNIETAIFSSTTYTILLEEGLYTLVLGSNNNTVLYYTLLSSYSNLQSCLLDITENLICTDLCNECYPDWIKDSVVLLSADYFLVLINDYEGIVETVTGTPAIVPASLSALPAFTNDALLMVKLATRLALYCDNCLDFKGDCGC